MKQWMKGCLLIGCLGWCLPAQAALPEAVERACFTTFLEDQKGAQSWSVSSWDAWRNVAGLTLSFDEDGGYVATLAGTEHPAGNYTTSVALASPAITAFDTQPMQTLTITVQAAAFVENGALLANLLHNTILPPFTIKNIGGRMVLIAKDNTWYIVIDDPKARVHQAEKNEWCVTVELPDLVFDKTQRSHTLKLHIGEGEVPSATIQALPKP